MAGLIFVLVRVYRATILEPANDTEGGLSSVLVSFKQPVKEQQSQPQQKQQTRSFDQLALNAHPVDEPPHYHTLQCQDYGGPNEKEAQEMVYWQGALFVVALRSSAM